MVTINEIMDAAATNLGYTDFEELVCIEDGPANPDDITECVKLVISKWQTDGWILSRKKMPEFDGEYLVYGWLHHSCGNMTSFQKVATCKFNQWVKSDLGEQMTYWRPLLLPPNEPEGQ